MGTPILGALSKISLHLILLLPILRDQQILFSLPFLGSCLRYEHPIAFLSKNLFGSQPQFAKPNFGRHKWFGLCLIFATLIVCQTLLIIWPTCHRVSFLANFCQSLVSNFLAILCGCHILPNFGLANYGCEPNRP
jgi:hypothetical protein